MAPKKNVTEEAFNAFREEVERNSQYLVNQLLQKIESLKEDYVSKIENIEENWARKLVEIEQKYELREQRASPPPAHNCINNNNLHHTDIARPTFFGNGRDIHPRDFLSRLEEYFAIKQTYVGEKIIVVGDCLKSNAYSWFSTVRFQLCNYEDFKRAFIDEYWSREIQIQVWSQCLNVSQVTANYREHFATWATKLRHLEVPRLSEPEIVKHIAKHYPGYLRAILVSLPERTIVAAMKILGEEENTNEKPEQTATDRNNNQQKSNNWNNQRNNGWNSFQPRNNRWNNNQPYRPNDNNKGGEAQQKSTPQTEQIQTF